nr:hypothetical protein [Fodinicola feengrottensis]
MPPTVTPEICAFLPVPSLTTDCIICCSCCATAGVIGWPYCDGLVLPSDNRSGPCTSLTRYGFISVPLLATAPAIMAPCSGVMRTSR